MSTEKVRIELDSTANTAGVDAMGKAVAGVVGSSKGAAEAAYDVSKGSKDMARGLGEGAAAGNAAVAAMSQLSTASQGGAGGLMAMARAGFAAGVSLKAVMASMGPFGIIAAGIGIAMGAISLALKKGEDSAKEAKDKLDEFNKTKLDDLGTELGKITTGANSMKTALDAANASAERISDAKLADQLAANKASDATPEAKERNEVAIRRRREDEKRAAAQKLLDDKAKVDADAYAEVARVANRELESVDDLRAKKDRLDRAQSNLQTAQVSIQSGGEGGLGAGLADYEKANAAQAEFDAANKAAGDNIAENLDAAVKRAKEAVSAISSVAGAAIGSQGKADLERFTQSQESGFIAGKQQSEDKIAAQTPEQKAAALAARLKQIEAMRLEGSEVLRNRAAGGAAVDAGLFKDAFPGAKPLPAGRLGAPDAKVAEALNKTAEATKGADSGAGTVKAAEGLQKATEEHAAAQQDAAAQTDAALGAAGKALGATATVLTDYSGRFQRQAGENLRIWGAIEALRSSRAA